MSFKYVPQKEIQPYYAFCASKMNELKQALQKKGIICTFYCIGSYAKHMVTRNGDLPFDLDFNLEIQGELPKKSSELQKLKTLIRSEMDRLITKSKVYHQSFTHGKDSTSAITYILHHHDSPNVKFSFDIGIVSRNKNGNLQRLIHDKKSNRFLWNEAKNSKDIEKHAKSLKISGYTEEIKLIYLTKKNFYLNKGDIESHPSFNVYIETINELYKKYFEGQETKIQIDSGKKNFKEIFIWSKSKQCTYVLEFSQAEGIIACH